jgi:hypothetical protein
MPETETTHPSALTAEADTEVAGNPTVRITSGIKFDPDAALDHISRLVETRIVNIDAKVFEGRPRTHLWQANKRQHYTSARQFFASPQVRSRIREQVKNTDLKETLGRLQESFSDEPYPDEQRSGSQSAFHTNDLSLPGFFGPGSRQMTLFDVLDAQRKCFEAATRNPIGKRVCKIIPQFVLARGVKGTHTDPAYQKAWNEFTKSQGMSMRIKTVLRELVIYGEVFMRYFNLPDGLAVRSLDPSTIWEIVTNPDDIEEVYYYHQQYVTLHQNIVASPLNGKNVLPASTLVIRQVPGSDIDHFKINATSHEKRGRSELYAILAWLVRFRDFVNDRVVLNKMRAMFALDVAVDGGALDLAAAEQQFATPPGSGSVLIHNKKVEVEFKNANTNANESKTDSEMILKIIAVGAGVSEQFLGVSYSTNRAGALIQTEPDVKNFEDYREITEAILSKAADRVAKSKRLPATDVGMEFTFPSIASEDRSAKVKDIALAEAMDYFSKARAASMVAREFDVTNFDHEQEQAQIRSERADDPVMATGYQQVEKVAPGQMEMQQQAADAAVEQTRVAGETKAAGLASAGKPGPAAKTKGGGKKPVKYTGAQGGVRSDKGGRGLPATKAALGRSKFSRGGEKTAIKNNRTSKTPILHEVDVREANTASTEVVFTRSGFSDKARTASIIERKRRRAARLMRMAEAAQTEADRAEAALKEQA